ncbi:E3 ubiquitin-protein ligase TRAIP-like [Lucilia sericata]|uniref:E3 ubiquitin-protein ligase TRAIP-like n=1 Tax=Lucilia sericata TaxID=13632 RepID=UPI0018A80C80|nr:E3 ubiquitin-protein ligase TRAIP-like [Lucilia sericata]
MSTKTAMLCTKCKEVLNSEDDIFGTSCGHLYHFLCLRECHGQSTNCSHCESYKPCMFKMFLEFGEAIQPINWEDQTKTIELHNELEESKERLICLEEKYKYSQVAVQKLEGKLKKHNDALKSKDITMADLEERITNLEELNSFLCAQLESKTKHKEETVVQNSNNQMKKCEHLSEQLEQEIAKNSEMSIENMKLKAFLNLANNEIGMDAINLSEHVFSNNQTGNTDQSKESGNHIEEIVSHTETISEPINQNSGNTNAEENSKQSASSNLENTTDSHTILIRNYHIQDLKNPLESVIIDMASRMKINLCSSDIVRVIKIKNNSTSVSLIVAFKNLKSRQEFLKNKYRLKKFKCTRYLEVCTSSTK